MNVVVNGEPRQLPDGTTVEGVVRAMRGDAPTRGVAVAVEGEVVRRGEWGSLALNDGARVEVLGAIGGG